MKPIKINLTKIRKILPVRNKSDNKTAGGKCLIIAGSKNMYGAGVLSAKSAYRVGAGYVYLATNPNRFPFYKYPEFLILNYHNAIDTKKFSGIGFGPGLGISKFSQKLLKTLLKSKAKKVIIDADGLNLLAKTKTQPLPEDWILTPHEGEMARLLNTTSKKIKNDRERAVRQAYQKFKCVILLKGSPTLICHKSSIYIIASGNVSLAKAGAGDVLTGIISGFLSQGMTSLDATILSSYLHGLIADNWIKKNDYLSLSAGDIIDQLPNTIKKIRKA